jgi:hypothetical protein
VIIATGIVRIQGCEVRTTPHDDLLNASTCRVGAEVFLAVRAVPRVIGINDLLSSRHAEQNRTPETEYSGGLNHSVQ